MKCKVCGGDKSWCSFDYYDDYMVNDYCSPKCFKNSEEYKVYFTKMQKFYDSLTKEQQVELWLLWDNGIFTDGKFEVMVDEIIVDPRSGE